MKRSAEMVWPPVIDLTKLEPPRDANGRPTIPPMEELLPAVHLYFREHRWEPKPYVRLVPPRKARRRWGDEPWRQFLRGGETDAGAVITAKMNYRRAMESCDFNKQIVDFLLLHLSCDRKACRRAKACAMIDVDCHDVVLPYLKVVFYPGLREEMARRAAAEEFDHVNDDRDDFGRVDPDTGELHEGPHCRPPEKRRKGSPG